VSFRYLLEIGTEPNIDRYSSTVRSELEPSNSTYPNDILENIKYDPRLRVPKTNNKISDSISGATKLTQYNITLENSDGKLDDVEALGWFNVPVVLKRSFADNPTLADFNMVLRGVISYPVAKEKTVTLIISDVYRSLTEQVTNTFNTTDYPNVFDNVKDRNIPIGFDPLKNAPLFRVDPSEYIALDKDYITAVATVYDRDGLSIAFTFNPVNGQINAIDAVTADVTGLTASSIGDIITKELEDKSGILYTADNWDLTEVDDYKLFSANVSFYFGGGTVRQLVDAVLKNDNAFLFTKNRGVLTIRQWGKKYKTHTIANWKFTKFPSKNYDDAVRYYNSSVVLHYNKDINTGDYINNLRTLGTPQFNKIREAPYFVDITSLGLIQDLSDRLIKRFGILSEIIPVSSAQPAIDIDLLDLIELDVNINGRQFSSKAEWVVREVDPCQDTLMLEARSGFITPELIDGILSQPFYDGIDGVLSQPYFDGIDGVLSQPITQII
jgi:hypothetical protein